jgi:hypothetical protein
MIGKGEPQAAEMRRFESCRPLLALPQQIAAMCCLS